ncbi:hypothetical protein LSCM1_03297 [Leishmania martiniquensis]|uniref:Uncharacterized protein n=1 Tax=Leishmania martiniquensis TaxID=1580590 RepID=A0A836GGA9_9TRYP|nr:hypothetical protein LSCM1_03297 [Leishmania martiniquensis]
MLTETQLKQVVPHDARRAPASSEKAAGTARAADAVGHEAGWREPKKGERDSSAFRGGGPLPPIHTRLASASETTGALHPRRQRPPSGRQELQQVPTSDRRAFPGALPAVVETPGRRPPTAPGAPAAFRNSDELVSPTLSPVPRRPPSAGRSLARHRRVQASSSRQARQPTVSPKGRSPTSARGGGAGRTERRPLSSQASRRTGLQSLKQEVENNEAAAGQLLQAEHTVGALVLLSRTLKSVQDYQAKFKSGRGGGVAVGGAASARAAPSAPSSGGPGTAWAAKTAQRLAEAYTTIATNAGVRSSTAAEPIQVQEAYFQAAMRYLAKNSAEDLFTEWTADSAAAAEEGRPPPQRQQRRRRARSPAPRPIRDPPSCFPSGRVRKSRCGDQQQRQQPAVVRRLLRCAVRTNAAVCLGDGATPGGEARIVYELLKALAESDSEWSMSVLYNLAVAFLRVGSYDDAAEAMARFMELSWHYLACAQPLQGTDDAGDACSAAAAVHAHAALQLIRGHHFIAAMAAWCEPQGPTELYHCELASACAERYLSGADEAQRACQRRLAAAQARANAGASTAETHPMTAANGPPTRLLLPYVPQELLLSCPSSTAAAGMGGATPTTVTMHELVEALTTSPSFSASLPAEVRAYVREVQKGAPLRYWASVALRAGASPPPLSAAIAASTAAPIPPILVALLCHGKGGDSVWARQSWMVSPVSRDGADDVSDSLRQLIFAATTAGTSADSMNALASLRLDVALVEHANGAASLNKATAVTLNRELSASSGATSPCKPSRPAPLFVTTLPSSAYDRYRRLRDGIVTQLENAEQMEQHEAGVADESPPLAVMCDDERPLSSSTVSPKRPSADASAAPSRRRRVTALLVGATSAATSPAASLSREGQGSSATGAFGLGEEEAVERSSGRSDATAAVLDPALLAIPVRPSELLRQLDLETEVRYSRLVADPLADVRRAASTCVQAWWRMQLARQARRRRAADVEACLRRGAAAARIQIAYRHWKECVPAKMELRRLRAHRERVRCVIIFQAFVQQRASVEVWGRACLVWYRSLVLQRKIEVRRAAATVTLQSWWRMHLARRQLCNSVTAAIRLQCAWRCLLARRELRTRRVHRRLAQEQWRHERIPQIIFVQRWWRACRSRWAVGDLLCRMQRSVEEYLTAQQSNYDAAMRTHLRSVENVEAGMRCVLGVLAGARDRRGLAQLFTHARVRQRAVHRFVLRWRGREALLQLRWDRAAALALQRRREEVAVATRTLQSWARMWLPRRRAARECADRNRLQAQALKIVRAFRCHRARQAFANGRAQRCMRGADRHLAEKQNDAAVRIQATWRMHRTRRELFDLLKFMLRDRHAYATAVQRLWRGHFARAVLAPQQGARSTEREAHLQHRSVLQCAAVRVQSFYRMYRVRIQLLRLGVQLPPTSMYRIAAARRIQTCWRAYAGYQCVSRARLQRSYALKQAHSQETLHAYATLIQAAARSYLMRRGRLPRPEPPMEALATVAAPSEVLVPSPPPASRVGAVAESSAAALHSAAFSEHKIVAESASLAPVREPSIAAQTAAGPIRSSCGAAVVTHAALCDVGDGPAFPRLVPSDTPALKCGSVEKRSRSAASLSCLTNTLDKLRQRLQSDSTGSVRSAQRPLSSASERSGAESHELVVASGEVGRVSFPTKGSAAQAFAYSADSKLSDQAATRPPAPQCSTQCPSSLCHHTPQEVEAATRIQALWRGYHVRSTIGICNEYRAEVEGEEVVVAREGSR